MNVHNNHQVYKNTGEINQYLWYGIFILWGLFMMDVITTEIILSLGGYEMNALMVSFVSSVPIHIALKMTVLVLIAVAAYISNRVTQRYGTITVAMIAIWYSFVIAHNLIQVSQII